MLPDSYVEMSLSHASLACIANRKLGASGIIDMSESLTLACHHYQTCIVVKNRNVPSDALLIGILCMIIGNEVL
jgi:hypothetical protein